MIPEGRPAAAAPPAARVPLPGLVAALGVAAAAVGAWRAVDLTWLPDGIPSFDVADYLNQALRYRDALAGGRLGDVGALLLVPNVHPPLHALALGAWLAGTGGGIAAACAFEVVLFVVALGLLVWVGHRADPVSGRWAGLGAAAITAWSTEHQRLSAAPMTENLALVAALVAVGASIPVVTRLRDDVGAFLLAGATICAAGLVRWNLAPMLFVPFLLAAVLEARTFAQVRDARLALLAAPTFFVLVAWARFRPDLFPELRTFFRNVDSGVPLTSAENLTWVPRTIAGSYLGAPVAVGIGALFVAGLVYGWACRVRPPPGDAPLRAMRVVQLVALVGLTAITAHPYKLERVLHGTVPFLVLGAMLPLARAAMAVGERGGVALVSLAVAALAARSGPDAMPRGEFTNRPEHRAVLDALVTRTRGARHVVVSGSHPLINRHSLELWHRLAGRDATPEADPALHPSCGDPAGVPADLDCTPAATRRFVEDPTLREETAIVLVERAVVGGPKVRRSAEDKARELGAIRAHTAAVEGLADTYGLTTVLDLDLGSDGGRVRVFRTP